MSSGSFLLFHETSEDHSSVVHSTYFWHTFFSLYQSRCVHLFRPELLLKDSFNKDFCLIEEFWLSIACGTVLHCGKKDIGLSLLFYLGWENTPSFELTKLGYIWKHSLWKMKIDFELWVLGLCIWYLKKKHKITTLTTIKKLLTTPLNTGLLPKKMGLNFIFKICIFSKIRCGVYLDSQKVDLEETKGWLEGDWELTWRRLRVRLNK